MQSLAITGAFVLSLFSTPVEAKFEPPLPIIETIEQRIDRVATAHGIATTTLKNLVECESNFDPNADNSYDRGLLQISRKYHPEVSDENSFNPEFALNWGAEKIAKDGTSEWVCGNCYLYVMSQLGKIPRMSEINPNTEIPRIGDIVVFYYKDKKHIAIIVKIEEKGFWVKEANFIAGKIGKRFVEWNDTAFVGFYSPGIAE